MKYDDILMIQSCIKEKVELTFYSKHNLANQYQITFIEGVSLLEHKILLISLDRSKPHAQPPSGSCALSMPQEFPTYFGKLEIFLCNKKKTLFNKEKLITIDSYKKMYSQNEWKNKEKISLVELFTI